jgi:hypothetical protein
MQTYESYTAVVNGIAWAGYKASCEYHFSHHPTRAEVIAKSGDFQEVTRVKIIKRTVTIERVTCRKGGN